MGRGRAKAKQTKVARDLKYRTHETDFGALASELHAVLERATWTPAPVFDLVRRLGAVPQPDLEATLNCGVGMVALLAPETISAAVSLLAEHGVDAWVAGELTTAEGPGGTAELVGQHPGW